MFPNRGKSAEPGQRRRAPHRSVLNMRRTRRRESLGATRRAGRARALFYNWVRHPASGRRGAARKRGFAKGRHCLAIVVALPGKPPPRPRNRVTPGSDTHLSRSMIHLLPAPTPSPYLPLPAQRRVYLRFAPLRYRKDSSVAPRAFGTAVSIRGDANKLDVNVRSASDLLHDALESVCKAKLVAYVAQVVGRALILLDRCSRYARQGRNLRKAGQNFVLNAISEVCV